MSSVKPWKLSACRSSKGPKRRGRTADANARLFLVAMQVLMHDLPRFMQAVVGRQIGEIAVHVLVILSRKQRLHVLDNFRRENSFTLIQRPLLFEDMRRLHATLRKCCKCL